MLCFIPIQQLSIKDIELGKLYWHNPSKPISPIVYHNEIVKMKQFCLLTPFCKVKHIDLTTGRIQLEIYDQSLFEKFILLQNTLLLKVSQEYHSFFPESTFTYEDIKRSFQPLVEKGLFTIYIPYGRNDTIHMYEKGNGWRKGIRPLVQNVDCDGLKIGDSVRIALKIYGIAYQYLESWTGRSRIQHQVVAIYKN
jgi:hypothetical protein